jgi:hypothetical protein
VTFGQALLGWHDFYLAAAGAAAALLGLLFVGVSINLGALNAAERVDLRERASQAFTNLTFVLVLSLSVLIPQNDPSSLAITCGILAVLGLIRVLARLRVIVRSWDRIGHPVLAVRRMSWTLVAMVFLGYASITLFATGSSSDLYTLITAVLLLLIGAADVSWDLLVRVSNEVSQHDQAGPPSGGVDRQGRQDDTDGGQDQAGHDRSAQAAGIVGDVAQAPQRAPGQAGKEDDKSKDDEGVAGQEPHVHQVRSLVHGRHGLTAQA